MKEKRDWFKDLVLTEIELFDETVKMSATNSAPLVRSLLISVSIGAGSSVLRLEHFARLFQDILKAGKGQIEGIGRVPGYGK